MGVGDKISNAAEETAGRAKETVGRVTGNRDLEAEGAEDQAVAKGKKIIEQVKDVKDSVAQAVDKIKKITE